MHSTAPRRAIAAIALAGLIVTLLSACLQPLTRELIDTDEIADAVTATSDSITSTYVETNIDGLTAGLWVGPVITSDGLSSDELDDVLRIAYEGSRGRVSSIEIFTMDANENPVDILEAADGLGIRHLTNVNSVIYSTEYLDEAYGN